ncbi:unnamed protein product [Calicophoron daubneyi]|uniref:EF-hand domain-containing protein n=2 Tax=Calicophoron daubneyi TaxID=300641 RepID=A0AAV2T6A8_CALDB
MSINPALKLKLDELFLRWLTDPATQKVLHQNLIQLKANEPLQAMLAVPSGVVVGPMSSSVYSFFYGSCRPESPGPNTEGSVNGVTTTSGAVGSLTSPRPNTPPYFPQPPHSKIFSPRSPRRHVPAANGVQSNPVSKGAGEARTVDGSVPKKPKKDEPVAPAARAKAATEVESESVGPGRPTVRGPPGHEEEVDRGKSGKSPARPSAERTVGKQGQQGPSPVPSATPAPEAAKSDTGAAQNLDSSSSITPTPKEAREPARHRTHPAQQQTGITSGGGLGDVSPSPSKPNGVLNRPSPTESHPAPVPKSSAQISSALTRKPIPSFYFPLGQTRMTAEEIGFEMDRAKRELMKLAEPASGNKNGTETMFAHANIGRVAKALNCPFYWKYAIYSACGGTNEHQPISLSAILKTWGQVLHACPDETARFVYLLTKGKATCLVQSDFNPLIQDILESHPGLAFLQAAKDFHSRYVATVVSRIFFNVNTSWSGRISLGELRKSNFLGVLASLEDEEDINLVTQYFSYEHFYVIYCKFWELDEDHDLIISRADLARHNNYAISERMIDRIFSGTVTRGTAFKEGVMTYPDFVWFLLAEEDKRHPRSIEYWFRCMDVDGDGLLSMYELEYFYSEQVARMEEMGIEPISFEDCLCQCLDMVKPALGDKIRLADLKQCRLCNIFFDTFFNLPKYLQHEQRDPFSNLRDIEEGLNELSDWDRYAAEAYEMLVAVEGGNQEDGVDEEEGDDEEVDEEPDAESPVPGSNDKADAAARKDTNTKTNTTNTKIDSNNTDHGTMNTTVGAGESVESSSPETGKKGKRKRGSTPTVNGTA